MLFTFTTSNRVKRASSETIDIQVMLHIHVQAYDDFVNEVIKRNFILFAKFFKDISNWYD